MFYALLETLFKKFGLRIELCHHLIQNYRLSSVTYKYFQLNIGTICPNRNYLSELGASETWLIIKCNNYSIFIRCLICKVW
jgi:hypothetical protein